MNRLMRRLRDPERGFTAIEISMVITVIAILALLIIPIFRDRVEAARRAAAQDEIDSIAKAEMLAFADTHYFFRPQDLDNTTQYNHPPVRPDQEVPIAAWNRPFRREDREKLRVGSLRWKGPYVSISKLKFLYLARPPDDAFGTLPEFFWSYTGQGGPIMDLNPTAPWLDPDLGPDHPDDKIPIDPWGTPYLFFGIGRLMEEGGAYIQAESYFGNAVIYSLGPDGMPGDQVPYTNQAQNLLRELGHLGEGDDFFRFL